MGATVTLLAALLLTAAPAVADPPPDMVAAGNGHSCALVSGILKCWGGASYGQVGDGTNSSKAGQVNVVTSGALAGKTITGVFAGGYSTCALDSDGKAYCWGSGVNGQLGNGTTVSSNVPVAVTMSAVPGGKFSTIAVGVFQVCALTPAGTAYCWGSNADGNLGNGNATGTSLIPTAVTMGGRVFQQLAAMDETTCALASDQKIYCWGYGDFGEIGNGADNDAPTPTAVSSGLSFVHLSAADSSACAIAVGGTGYCWGDNEEAQIGNNTRGGYRNTPTAVTMPGGILFQTMSAGAETNCALSTTGRAYCWGFDGYGNLGNGPPNSRSRIPVAVSTSGVLAGRTLVQLSASAGYHHCGIDTDNLIFCWGENDKGQLADLTFVDRSTPVRARRIPVAPSAPQNVHAEPGDQEITVTWDPPASLGSAPAVTAYRATATGGLHCDTTGATTCPITGLTNGTTYQVTVTATTEDGTSVASGTASATPRALPSPPTDVDVTPGSGQIDATWTAPTSFGSGAFIRYTATAAPGGQSCHATTTTSCTITGLSDGTTYTVNVVTETTAGLSTAAVSTLVTPATPVLPDPLPSPLDGTLTLTPSGTSITVTGTGYAPHTLVAVGVYSAPTMLGIVETDLSGNFTTTVPVPAGPTGVHTFASAGPAPGGLARVLGTPVDYGGIPVPGQPDDPPVGELPVTGPSAGTIGVVGLALLALGVRLIRRSRRARLSETA